MGTTTRKIALSFENQDRAARIFDYAFRHPKTHLIIIPKDQRIALEWLEENAYLRHFGWGDPSEYPPMRYGDLMHLDELYYRDRCGYAGRDFTCTHPEEGEEDEKGRRLCFATDCPLAYRAGCTDFKERDPDLYKEYNCGYSEEEDEEIDDTSEWMILIRRPREAYVENITVEGLSIKSGIWLKERRNP